MPWPLDYALRLPRKVANTARLMWRDPERAGRNLLQYTDPALFRSRLVDIVHAVPMHVRHEPGPRRPRLNVLDSAWSASSMTGGPNTVLNLALRVARQGVEVRIVATVGKPALEPAWFARHCAALLGGAAAPPLVVAHAGDPGAPLDVGPGDMFLATHWSTALQLKPVLPAMKTQQFLYMLQEFEAGFYPWSSNYARVLETYGMDFWPIVNEQLLADFLFAQKLGRLDTQAVRDRALVFEPAVDRSLFFPPRDVAKRPKRVVFYARPTNARNMFGLGLMALEAAAVHPAFAGWEFLAIGSRDSVPALVLGGGHVLQRAPWLDYAQYADLLRDADVLLCPMLSPHTSYPVLEMAACGGIAVTNVFASKTHAALAALSPRIIAVEPSVEGFAAGLIEAASRVEAAPARLHDFTGATDWNATLEPVAERVASIARQWADG